MKTDNVVLDTLDRLAAPVDLDPIVMDLDGPGGEPIDIPEGWDLLPGGVERTIGVNMDWIRAFMGRPWRIEVGGKLDRNVEEFRVLGESRAVAVQTVEQVYNCGVYSTAPKRAARIATTAPILIRR